MTTTTIRMPEDKYKEVQSLASFEGLSVSAFMRKAVLEQVEDVQDYTDGMKVLEEGNGRISRGEVLKEVFSD
ncbi:MULTISPECIES: type II toxin-antitoxin system RelB family antitoxin [Lactobacillaceae]|jgi:predicted DNA-binding protein|uniref:DUF6290 family protein n=1 Tax=Lactiplantibacillus pentosus TaxID=1589 RepID=A0AAP5PYN5_LACPE|nr:MULTISPECIES: DUF6290 family protein [Lactobacillaceae]MBT9654474.1 ribbon-helix-helix protein, CopG family [Lactiplantibacillus plantarum]MBU7462634.1 ribbon-helix-helix protein, CopG family [Lactiplantibacillus pentosus]MBU7485309.1 ribbon-helix-helix protein, CopG family [Lactiplantibacillus sp. 30.2.29]MBU7488541.1 ribbon-helix-helix protein, CopG family [Lactiplantibacillus pentosus]MBU7501613.1 ribbon-helix-helix protein, CopG family [Lactiplantibacillus pentosus]